jgi:hypothetical protein
MPEGITIAQVETLGLVYQDKTATVYLLKLRPPKVEPDATLVHEFECDRKTLELVWETLVLEDWEDKDEVKAKIGELLG